ncbi:hypothetical protein Hanom_Chr06g00515591 [Helianthus anomalus]
MTITILPPQRILDPKNQKSRTKIMDKTSNSSIVCSNDVPKEESQLHKSSNAQLLNHQYPS